MADRHDSFDSIGLEPEVAINRAIVPSVIGKVNHLSDRDTPASIARDRHSKGHSPGPRETNIYSVYSIVDVRVWPAELYLVSQKGLARLPRTLYLFRIPSTF
jgi:hypothetical protein